MRYLMLVLAFAACGDDSVGNSGGAGGSGGSGGSGGMTIDAGPIIPPGDPGMGDVRFDIDSTMGVHAISPFIYGTNAPDWSGTAKHLAFARAGGNRWTAYNWENNASNAGTDYMNQNDGLLGGGSTPGEAVRPHVADALNAGANFLVTIPVVGYVAADESPGGDVDQTPNYLQTRFKVSHAAKGAPFVYPPDTTDPDVYEDEFVHWLSGQFPVDRVFYSLDNEPDLWSSTHPRIHPNPVTYAELMGKTTEYAAAIKAVVPQALVFGPVSYGWNGYTSLQNASDANGRDFLEFYLDSLKQAEQTAGRRLVDVLDLHWYPEATGGGVRIIGQDTTADVVAARLQAPRSLWDPNYTETSWITQFSTNGPIRLIPRLKDKIAANDPGTLIAFTEYDYGGGADISGGLAEADVLGIFGREDVFAAALWELAADESFIYGALAMFRNFDGANGSFGATSIQADTSAVGNATVYASVDDPSRLVIVAINKTGSPLVAAIAVTHTTRFSHAEVYQLTAASATPAHVADEPITAVNAFRHTLPAMSVTTLVLRP